ncbi:MAG: rod shape-determining protein RodA [Armatimonadetes bacterium]|nr:rod shape-determining protein RodA [Armatimonadota bacterium]
MIQLGGAKGAFASSVHRPGRGIDLWLLASAGILLLTGLLAIYSIDFSRHGSNFMIKQVMWAAIGVPVFVICATTSQRTFTKLAPWLYTFSVLSLVAVLLVGKNTKGATRWIDFGPIQFQPSEFAKVILIITLSAFYAKHWEQTKEFRTYVLSLVHIAPIVGLVLLQPHLAGAMSLVFIWVAISLYAGVPWKYAAITLAIVGSLATAAWFTPGVVPNYMRERVIAKIKPDAKDNGYQQERARIAFAVGGVTGVGYLKGGQKAARYIPEQQNDFIFTVVGEEGGLIGGSLVLLAFGFFFYRLWLVGYQATEPFGQMMSGGVLAILGFHTIVNLGMNVGILPVAGLWLPFVSYGGTALWMCMACVGLLTGVK